MQIKSTEYTVVHKKHSTLAINQVLRKTYLLLSSTLVCSALVAKITLAGYLPFPSPTLTLVGMFGLLFLSQALSKGKWGLFGVFAFTGFMGYVLAPLLYFYLNNFSNGGELVVTALGGTGAIFLSLSLYALITRKNFDYLGGFLFVAISVAFLASLITIFTNMPILQILVSCAFVLICSGLILFHTSQLIHGGERNYIVATISLYVALFNLFVSLLQILGAFGGRRS